MNYDENSFYMVSNPDFCLEGFMRLSQDCNLKEISFDGDDGNSSLIGNFDFGNEVPEKKIDKQ